MKKVLQFIARKLSRTPDLKPQKHSDDARIRQFMKKPHNGRVRT